MFYSLHSLAMSPPASSWKQYIDKAKQAPTTTKKEQNKRGKKKFHQIHYQVWMVKTLKTLKTLSRGQTFVTPFCVHLNSNIGVGANSSRSASHRPCEKRDESRTHEATAYPLLDPLCGWSPRGSNYHSNVRGWLSEQRSEGAPSRCRLCWRDRVRSDQGFREIRSRRNSSALILPRSRVKAIVIENSIHPTRDRSCCFLVLHHNITHEKEKEKTTFWRIQNRFVDFILCSPSLLRLWDSCTVHIHAAKHTTKRSSKKFQAGALEICYNFFFGFFFSDDSIEEEVRGPDWGPVDQEEAREPFAVALEPLKANGELNESHSDSSHITSGAGACEIGGAW